MTIIPILKKLVEVVSLPISNFSNSFLHCISQNVDGVSYGESKDVLTLLTRYLTSRSLIGHYSKRNPDNLLNESRTVLKITFGQFIYQSIRVQTN